MGGTCERHSATGYPTRRRNLAHLFMLSSDVNPKPAVSDRTRSSSGTKSNEPQLPTIVDLASLPGVPCPCGIARRAFADNDQFPGTVHLTEISEEAACHYHRDHTEVYVILEANEGATMELDGESLPVGPLTSILIPPGVRHRAVGKMRVLIICTPNFDPADEYFD